jgi:hypothetical protein
MSSLYFDAFLDQIFQERSSLCTLETVYSNVVACLLILRHASTRSGPIISVSFLEEWKCSRGARHF